MKVVGLQHDITWEDAEATQAALAPRIAAAAQDGADLVVLTEMFATGFAIEAGRIAQEVGGTSERFLVEQAAQHRITLIGSIAQFGDDGRARNVCVVASPTGVIARYAKIHPFRYGGEHLHYAPGHGVVTVGVGGMRVTPLVCYDLRFAGLFQRLGDAGLEPVDRRALHLPLLGAHRAQRLQKLGDGALLAERADAHGFESSLIRGRGDGGRDALFENVQTVAHAAVLSVEREVFMRKTRASPASAGSR